MLEPVNTLRRGSRPSTCKRLANSASREFNWETRRCSSPLFLPPERALSASIFASMCFCCFSKTSSWACVPSLARWTAVASWSTLFPPPCKSACANLIACFGGLGLLAFTKITLKGVLSRRLWISPIPQRKDKKITWIKRDRQSARRKG